MDKGWMSRPENNFCSSNYMVTSQNLVWEISQSKSNWVQPPYESQYLFLLRSLQELEGFLLTEVPSLSLLISCSPFLYHCPTFLKISKVIVLGMVKTSRKTISSPSQQCNDYSSKRKRVNQLYSNKNVRAWSSASMSQCKRHGGHMGKGVFSIMSFILDN